MADLTAELLYDAVLIGVPSILATGSPDAAAACRRELLLYFQTIADQSPLPIVLFSSRDRRIPIDALVDLAAHPRILGLLDDVALPAGIQSILHRIASIKREVTVTPVFAAVTARMKAAATHASASFVSADSLFASPSTTAVANAQPTPPLRTRTKVLAGNTHSILEALRGGAVGAAPAFAAAAPQACYEVLAAWKDDDQPLAEEKQTRLVEAARLAEASPGNLKFACDLNGYFGGLPRLPQLPPTGEQRAAIEQIMKPIRN